VPKPLAFTQHARARMREYGITELAVAEIVVAPEWVEPDPQPDVERRFRRLPELGGRFVRVACIEDPDYIRVLSVFPDRDARPPHAP